MPNGRKEKEKEWRLKNKEKLNGMKRLYWDNNKEEINEKRRVYYKTKRGMLARRYENLKRRSKRKNMPLLIEKQDFIQWGLNNPRFNELFEQDEIITIDRINNKGYYTFDNMQFLTMTENSQKAYSVDGINPRRNFRKVKVSNEKVVLTFNTLKNSARFLSKGISTLRHHIKRKNKVNGWNVEYAGGVECA